jgi:hypothetical protein
VSWQRLDDRRYAGPLVQVLLSPTGAQPAAPLACTALIDTGATHSIVDSEQVAGPLRLRTIDLHRLAVAGHQRAEVPVHELWLDLPDHPFPARRVRVASMRLPGPFQMLIGMDLLQGSRLSLELGANGHWLRWEPL